MFIIFLIACKLNFRATCTHIANTMPNSFYKKKTLQSSYLGGGCTLKLI